MARGPERPLGPYPTFAAIAVGLSQANPTVFDPPLTRNEVAAACQRRAVPVLEGRVQSSGADTLADIYFAAAQTRGVFNSRESG